jgi:hypothetical protein
MKIEHVKVVSFLPGRVRLRVRELKAHPELVAEIEQALGEVSAIKQLDINPTTGSVLIQYDRKPLKEPETLAQLRGHLETLFPTLDSEKVTAWLADKA